MAIRSVLQCDGCLELMRDGDYAIPIDRMYNWREEAGGRGWKRRGKRHYCPQCARILSSTGLVPEREKEGAKEHARAQCDGSGGNRSRD